MTDANLTPRTFAMPEIPGVTVPHGGLHFLQPELLLDFISVCKEPLASVTPVAVLYSTVGVRQRIDLRKPLSPSKGELSIPSVL
ncbi:hypothetical protein BADSM9389_30230 [Buttiauxella agrestis]|nr:hypothetical protein BADSM9389_30230 [Buttiauxella agrestis]